jgi:hypothetical protein
MGTTSVVAVPAPRLPSRYRGVREIGRGGMAEIFGATEPPSAERLR